jgi:hypothetical protein
VTDTMERLFKPLEMFGRHVNPDNIDPLENHSVQVMYRTDFLPRLSVRRARVEDNDDLLPILEASNPNLIQGQEDFFLADLVASQGTPLRCSLFTGQYIMTVVYRCPKSVLCWRRYQSGQCFQYERLL